jgi:hypothetical protein
MAINYTNINKTKESLRIDGQHFYQYQQNKRKFKQKKTLGTIPKSNIKTTERGKIGEFENKLYHVCI